MSKNMKHTKHPLFQFITWCTLYTFTFQTMCCSVWAYSPPTMQPPTHVAEINALFGAIADFLVTPAQAESDAVEGSIGPEDNRDDITGNPIGPEEGSDTENTDEFSSNSTGTTRGAGGGGGVSISGGSGSVNSSMGAYGYSYPIQVPPGRGGLAPQLALNYSSLAGNGWLGLGWNLSIGSIERSIKKGKPGYTDKDTFVITLKGTSITLVRQDGEFRLKEEGLFLRVRKLGDRWEAKDKGGTTYSFGSEPNSRQMAPEGIYKWCLNSIADPNGNTIHFTYETDAANNQIYLKQISYDANNVVMFVPEYDRVDASTSYSTHFKVHTNRRLKKIIVLNGGNLVRSYKLYYEPSLHTKQSKLQSITHWSADRIGMSTRFEYTSVKSPFGFKHLVEKKSPKQNAGSKNFHMADFNGDGMTDYLEIPNSGASGTWMLWISKGENFALMSSGTDIIPRHKIVTGDYNGDGKADILTHDPNGRGHAQLYLSTGNSFTNVKNVFPVESKKLHAGDFNGDGKTDILTRYSKKEDEGDGGPDSYQHGWKLFFANNKQGFDLSHSWIDRSRPTPSKSLDKQNIILGDYNGDGKTDVIMKPDVRPNGTGVVSYGMYLSTGSSLQVVKQGEHGNDQIPYRYDNVYPGDYNGDGKTDLLVTASGHSMSNWEGYKLNLSTDTDFITIDVPLADLQPAHGPPNDLRPDFESKIFPGDYNGDGLTDVIQSYHGNDSTVYSLSRYLSTGSGFEQHVETQIQSKPTQTSCFSGDFDGDGRLDIFLVDKEQNLSKTVFNKAKFMGSNGDRSVKLTTNNLLGRITNELGATTEITYKPSTIWPRDIDGDGRYYPMPTLPTISAVTSYDNMGKEDGTSVHISTSTFAYEGGRYDMADKEFRGYGKIWMGDSTSQLVGESYFHQEPRFQGRLKKSITSLSPGEDIPKIPVVDRETLTPVVVTDNTWKAIPYVGQSNTGKPLLRTFAYVLKTSTINYNGDDPLSTAVTVNRYDVYGNLELENKWVNTAPDQEKSLTRCTETEYNNDKSRWLLGRPKSIRVSESATGQAPSMQCGPPLRESTMLYYPDRPWLMKSTTQKVDKKRDRGVLTDDVTTHYKYDAYGNRTWTSSPRDPSRGTTFDYSESNGMFPNLTTNALGHEIHRSFNPYFGKITSQTLNPGTTLSQTTTTIYNGFGRPEAITYPDGSQKTIAYTIAPKRHSIKVESSLMPTVITYYDNLDREIRTETTADGVKIFADTTYNSRGQVWMKSLPYYSGEEPLYSVNAYDKRGRIESVTNADGTSRSMQYDGFSKTITNENKKTKTLINDSLGRLTEVRESSGGITKYKYDLFGNLTWTKGPLGNETHISYDQLDRKIDMIDPYMGHWEYRYDNAGNLEWQKDNKDRITELEYDELNRLRLKRYTSSGRQIEYFYDEPDGSVSFYNRGNLTRILTTEPGGSSSLIRYNYDKMGRKAEENRTIDNASYTIKHQYDLAGRIDILTYPDKTIVDYDYHPMGYLQEVSRTRKDGKRWRVIRYKEHNAIGQVGKVLYQGGGVVSNYTYWPGNQRLKTLQTTAPYTADPKVPIQDNTGGFVQNLSYTFDNLGNVTTITDNLHKAYTEYSYDSLSRLKTARATCASDPEREYNQIYDYDLAGNMIQKRGKAAFRITDWEDPEKHINPTSVIYHEDTPGVGNRVVEYNQDNKPIRIDYQDGKTTSIQYDGEGNRIKKDGSDFITIYIGGIYEIRKKKHSSYIEELNHIFAGGQRVASTRDDWAIYNIGDHLGSTSLIIDQNGMPIEEFGYLPFGSVLFHKAIYNANSWNSHYRFTGQEFDKEYELYNYNARLYDPIMGRFITADTVVPDWTDPQSLNRYSYCRNNPVKYIDPSGHEFFSGLLVAIVYGGLIGAAVGGLAAYAGGDDVNQGIKGGYISGVISAAAFYSAGSVVDFGKAAFKWSALVEKNVRIGAHVVAGSSSGAVSANMTGGDPGQAASIGGVSAGLSEYIGGGLLEKMGVGAAAGGTASVLNGGDFGEGAIQGAWTTYAAVQFNLWLHPKMTTDRVLGIIYCDGEPIAHRIGDTDNWLIDPLGIDEVSYVQPTIDGAVGSVAEKIEMDYGKRVFKYRAQKAARVPVSIAGGVAAYFFPGVALSAVGLALSRPLTLRRVIITINDIYNPSTPPKTGVGRGVNTGKFLYEQD